MPYQTLLLPLSRFIERVESIPVTLSGALAGFSGVLMVRYLLEGLSSRTATGFLASDISTIVHYSLFYITVFLGTILLLAVMARVSIVQATKIGLFASMAIWIAPTIDIMFFGGYPMGYVLAGPSQLIAYFVTYFGPIGYGGITPGIRIELALVLLGATLYVYTKTRSMLRSVCTAVFLYTFAFISVSAPSLILAIPILFGASVPTLGELLDTSLLSRILLHPGETFQAVVVSERLFNAFISQVFLLLATVFVFVWFYRWNPVAFKAFVGNLRIPRLVGYLALASFGALLALLETVSFKPNIIDWYTIATAVLGIAAAWVFAVATNDLVDEDIDRITNSSRPLIQGTLSRETMRNIAILSGMWIVFAGVTLGSYALFFLATYTAAYFIYSVPPLRLKRIPVLSSLLISLACLSAVLFGYYVISSNRIITEFPLNLIFFILIFFTIAVNFKDLKDIEGDRAAHITTLATLLGQRHARMVFGGALTGATALAALFLPLPFGSPLLAWSTVIASAVVWVGMVLGQGERFLFITFLAYCAFALGVLLF